ncbi:hypothetical protein BGW38_009496 [Lunasporangiospora selenospora]|uniref:Tubulin-specific chaperone A n=1 Tax=Lunasporangiospora selenospora TaxID=979761 RepID=A0A9P6FX07_9FUNG|nr:hypothetical protein BGW38_009496 [Lunasporangiospora selenospora]
MVANEGDEYDIRKQREVLQETLDMIPDVERRRRAAREDLANIVTKVSAEVKATKEYEEATQVLENTE